MDEGKLKFLQKHLRIGSIDVHPTQKALVVRYELEASAADQMSDAKLGETKEVRKKIKINNLNEDTDVKILAYDIIEKCPMIPDSKRNQIEQLLYYLKCRRENSSDKIEYGDDAKFQVTGRDILGSDLEESHISCLDDYIELMYEGIPEKIQASRLVLKLARSAENLIPLSKNDALIGALARVLREDGRKSLELSTNLVYTFFCFSTFRQFHPIIAQHKIGSLCISMVESELQRFEEESEELMKKSETNFEENDSLISDDKTTKLQKYYNYVKRQNQLLRVCFYLLYNISDDPKVEIKMVNRGIVGMLSACLKRDHPELLILVVSFLKKLSVYIENKVEMIEHNVIGNLNHLLSEKNIEENPDLVHMVLRLLFNLSFAIEMRSLIVKSGYMPKLIKLLTEERFRTVALGILYHISMEDKYKSLLTYIDCIPIVIDLINECPETVLPMHLIAFGINLSLNKRNAQVMSSKKELSFLMKRAMLHEDALLMKMIRNISEHEGSKDAFLEYVDDLCSTIVSSKSSDDFVLECIGTLSNIASEEIDFEKIFVRYNLLDFMKSKFLKETEDDFLLEVIILCAATAVDEACAAMILESGILKSVINFLNAKQEDDEIVLQVVYLFYRLIYHPEARQEIIKKTTIPAYLTDLMHDKNPFIKEYCGLSIDMITKNNQEWAKKIQIEKFRFHNSQWLEMIESQQIEDGDFNMDDSYIPCIQENDILGESDFLYGSGAYEGMMDEGSLSPDDIRDVEFFGDSDNITTKNVSNRAVLVGMQ